MNDYNLKPPWKKGQSGNPKGRPRKKHITDELLLLLKQKITLKNPLNKQDEEKTIKEHLSTIILAKGLSGDMRAIRELLDRVEGKPEQEVTNINIDTNIDTMTEIQIDEELKQIEEEEKRLMEGS